MVMILVKCFIVLHSSLGIDDYKSPAWIYGYVEKEAGSAYVIVDFYDDFVKKHVNMSVNTPEQRVRENDCLYLRGTE